MRNSMIAAASSLVFGGFIRRSLAVVIAVGLMAGPSGLTAEPFAYVTNQYSNTISVIDTATNTVTATVTVGEGPYSIAITPDGAFAYVAEAYDWLVVNLNGTNAQYKGSGAVNGNLGPAGEAYKFVLWARDFGNSGIDTFCIKIWYVDAGSKMVIYDNGFDQTIGGGNIVLQTN